MVVSPRGYELWGRTERKYPRIRRNLEFSSDSTNALAEVLRKELGAPMPEDPCVVVSGSLARLEASPLSDADYMLIYPGKPRSDAPHFRMRVQRALSSYTFADEQGRERTFPSPNPKGVFWSDVAGPDLYSNIGSKQESYDTISQRMLILLEARPLWNPAYFDVLRRTLLSRYGQKVGRDPTKNFVELINDLIRYFRQLCVNYYSSTMEDSEVGKWPVRNVKLRHSRVLMYMSLLLTLGELSRPAYSRASGEASKISTLRTYIDLPPLERIVRLYDANDDDNLYRVLGLYDVFLEKLSDPSSRAILTNLDYSARYENTTFSALKANSDAFAAELTRFVLARRGSWSDRFFEYVIL